MTAGPSDYDDPQDEDAAASDDDEYVDAATELQSFRALQGSAELLVSKLTRVLFPECSSHPTASCFCCNLLIAFSAAQLSLLSLALSLALAPSLSRSLSLSLALSLSLPPRPPLSASPCPCSFLSLPPLSDSVHLCLCVSLSLCVAVSVSVSVSLTVEQRDRDVPHGYGEHAAQPSEPCAARALDAGQLAAPDSLPRYNDSCAYCMTV